MIIVKNTNLQEEEVKASCIEVLENTPESVIREMIQRFEDDKASFLYWDEGSECGCFVGTWGYLMMPHRQNSEVLVMGSLYKNSMNRFDWRLDSCKINEFFCHEVRGAKQADEKHNLKEVIGWMKEFLNEGAQ